MKLLFLHGIAQAGKSSEILREHWVEALNLGLSKSRLPAIDATTSKNIVVPFYGDALAGTKPDRLKRGTTKAAKLDADFAEFAIEYGVEALKSSDNLSKMKSDPNITDDRKKRDIQNWSPVIHITRGLDKTLPGISSAFIGKFLKEVHSYLSDEAVQKSIDRIVTRALNTDDRLIVVSHSLGTVVAYHLLASANKISVPQFITLGSPLAIKAVKGRLREKPHKPACVSNWLNGFDTKDIVALNPLNAKHFARTEPAIRNNARINNFTENHHSIDGYLADANVAKLIYQSLNNN